MIRHPLVFVPVVRGQRTLRHIAATRLCSYTVEPDPRRRGWLARFVPMAGPPEVLGAAPTAELAQRLAHAHAGSQGRDRAGGRG